MREPLTHEQIVELDAALIEAYAMHFSLRSLRPIADLIKLPPIPSALSESIVVRICPNLFGQNWSAEFGGRVADILLSEEDGQTLRIEVKATARSAFQELKIKDIRADLLVWVHFGARYEQGWGSIEIYTLSDPGSHFDAERTTLSKFLERVGDSVDLEVQSFNSLDALLSGS